MYTEYNEYDLLELFLDEPIAIHGKEAGMFIYSITDDFGFKLILSMSIYAMKCDISLSYKDYSTSIFEFNYKNVKSIEKKGDKMIITSGVSDDKVSFAFYPNFAFEEIKDI